MPLYNLYGYEHVTCKTGKDSKKQFVSKETYRIVRFRPYGKMEDALLITNIFNMRAEIIALMYRRRRDMEVFFRFFKQEVNFSHFLSLSQNGIEVMLYMILTVAMMIMIYKKENSIGFKTAKRRMMTEMQELTMAAVVVKSGQKIHKIIITFVSVNNRLIC
jgi:IS4 transposase